MGEKTRFRMSEAESEVEKSIVAATEEFLALANAIAKRTPQHARMIIFNGMISAFIQLAAIVNTEEKGAILLRHAADLLERGYAYEHLLVWVAAGRERPRRGELIHHDDENKRHYWLANLKRCRVAKHSRDHAARQRRDRQGRFATWRRKGAR